MNALAGRNVDLAAKLHAQKSSFSNFEKPEMPTRPGVHPKADLGRFERDEVSIVNCLARSFYITRAGILEKGNSIYRFVLARPCDDIKYVLNYDREVIVLFSPYSTFEARSLECFVDIESNQPDIRLERSIRFLFSRDEQIAQQIDRFLKSEPEFPTVCAFLYNETRMFSTQENLSQNLRRIFYARDIFNFHSPLKTDHFFFGRNELIKSIVDRHLSNESTGVFGLRRTGKTSLIHALGRVARAAKQPLLHVDCQTTDVHLKRWHTLIDSIEGRIRSTYSIKRSSTSPITPDNVAATLRATLVELKRRQGSKLLIAFDEVENISPKTSPSTHWRDDSDALLFWQTIRALCQDSAGLLSCVVVGINPVLIENVKLCGYDNPLFKFMNVNYIKGFSQEQTHDMCNTLGKVMGLQFDLRSTAFLTDHFGGNPYLIRQACSQLHQGIAYVNRPAKVSEVMVEDAAAKIETSASTYASGMLEVLKEFYPDEFELLCWLAADKTEDLLEFIKENRSSINHLCGYGVIDRDTDKYFFRVKIFLTAMKQYLEGRSDLLTQDKKREFINRSRNKIEQTLREITRNIILAQYGRRGAKDNLLAMLTKKRQEFLKDSEITDILSTDSSKLYLSDFFGIIDSLSNQFENLTNMPMTQLKSHIDTINSSRFDAHANRISDTAFNDFRLAFTSLSDAFSYAS